MLKNLLYSFKNKFGTILKGNVFKGLFRKEKMTEENKLEVEKSKKKAVAKPSWVKMKSSEMEDIVVELAKKGELPAKIGLILRDQYGVPKSKVFGKKITDILKEKGVVYKVEKNLIEEKIEDLKGHIKKNKRDYPSSRALTKKLWDLRRIEQFEKRTSKIK